MRVKFILTRVENDQGSIIQCCFITIELRDPEYHALLPAEKYNRVIGTSIKLKTETSSLKNHSN
jgi:hypothetical protein